jgi:hypothetical protein
MRVRWLGASGVCAGALREQGEHYDLDDTVCEDLLLRGVIAIEVPAPAVASTRKPAPVAVDEE